MRTHGLTWGEENMTSEEVCEVFKQFRDEKLVLFLLYFEEL